MLRLVSLPNLGTIAKGVPVMQICARNGDQAQFQATIVSFLIAYTGLNPHGVLKLRFLHLSIAKQNAIRKG